MTMRSRKKTSSAFALNVLCVVVFVTCGKDRACRDWIARVDALAGVERAQLNAYGARAFPGGMLFSAGVVPNCELRARFSRFASSVIRGTAKEPDDVMTVGRKPREFVAALVAVWPTRDRRFPGADGAFRDELSSLLVAPEIGTAHIRPLIATIIGEDGVTGEVAYALLTRPDPFFVPHVRRSQSEPRSIREELLALAVLQRFGHDTRSQLVAMQRREGLTPTIVATTHELLNRYRMHQPPQWDDVIDVASH